MAAELPVPAPGAEVGLVLAVQLVAELAAGQLAAAEAADLSVAVPSAVRPKPRKSKRELHRLQNSARNNQDVFFKKQNNRTPFNSKHVLHMCVHRDSIQICPHCNSLTPSYMT